ncbi:MAG: GNAT family N-acetyltransferase [Alphaproteobacteria bacterium]|jgi:RimJ/RimL family protein N-acetyltransferase|nr:GNAT family N-acetyltransferase [Alphaproteobacteria bacterium]
MSQSDPWLPLESPRLLLRDWRDEDLPAFAALNADPRVMAFLPARLDRAQSDALAARIRAQIRERGFGWWALEVAGVAPFVGFVGLSVPQFQAHFTPCVEISWRLAAEHWGRGYATEAARLALTYGFDRLGLSEIVSFTTRANQRSRAVMARLGLRHDPADDFDHPSLPPGHPLRPHVLYRASPRDRPAR